MRLPALVLLTLASAGCLGAVPEPEAPRADQETDASGTRPIEHAFRGTSTGTPAAPDEQRFVVDVPRGAVGVNGTLTFARPPVELPTSRAEPFQLALLDPDGEVVSQGYRDVEGRLVVVTIDPPRPGEWTFVVRGVATVASAFDLAAVIELIVPEDNLLVKSLELGQASFFEINMILEEGASFRFSFNASAPVRWDVHSHPPEGLKEWDAGEGTTAAVEFEAPARDVYSILWENPGALPVDLAYEVHGRFRLHSHSG